MAVSLLPSTESTEYNPDGTIKKKTTVQTAPDNAMTGGLPTQSPSSTGQIVPLTAAAQSGAAVSAPVAPVAPTTAGTEQANTAVLAKAQTGVLNAPGQSALQSAYTQKALDFVNNPMGDYNGQKVKQAAMDSANLDWGNSFEGLRQQYGNISGSGLLQENMLKNTLQHNTDMAKLGSDLDQTNYDRLIDATTKSLAAAQSAEQQNRNIFSQGLTDAATVRGMAEGERAQETGFKQNVELTKMGFDDATQKMALANGYDLAKMNAQFGYDMAKMVANNDFIGAQNKIKQDFELALQTNDINAVAKNIQTQVELDKWKQQNGQEFTAQQNALNRALETSLKTMDIDGQKELFDLKTKADEGLLLKQQDFQGAQAAAQRALEEKMQGTDIQAAINAMNQKAEIDRQAQEAQNAYNTTERIATQGYNTEERLSQQDFTKLMKTYETEMALALQNNDADNAARLQRQKELAEINMLEKGFDNTKELAGLDAKLKEAQAAMDFVRASQLQAQIDEAKRISQNTAENHDIAMAKLQAGLDDAAANNDVVRQKALMSYKADLDMSAAIQNQGFQIALQNNQGKIDKALKANDFVYAQSLQRARISAEALQNAKARELQRAELKLKERGINMDEFANIKSLVEQGYLEPEAAQAQLDKLMTYAGMNASDLPRLQNPNSPDTIRKTLDAQYESTKYQWATTMQDQNPAFIDGNSPDGLSDAGRKEFAKFYTESLYGKPESLSEIIGDIANLQGAANETGTPERRAYDAALAKATPASNWGSSTNTGIGDGTDEFKTVPNIGTYINKDGKLYKVTSGVAKKRYAGGPDKQYVTMLDVNTGETINFEAGKADAWK